MLFSIECSAVVWSRPPNACPIGGAGAEAGAVAVGRPAGPASGIGRGRMDENAGLRVGGPASSRMFVWGLGAVKLRTSTLTVPLRLPSLGAHKVQKNIRELEGALT